MGDRGISLIELMVAVLIVAILAAIAVPWYVTRSIRAREAMVELNMCTMQQAVENFASMAEGYYPATGGNALTKRVSRVLASFGIDSHNSSRLADRDPMWGTDTSEGCLLPGHNTYRNPFGADYQCAVSESNQPNFPVTTPGFATSGLVKYMPVLAGAYPPAANGYAIFGDGHKMRPPLVLTGKR